MKTDPSEHLYLVSHQTFRVTPARIPQFHIGSAALSNPNSSKIKEDDYIAAILAILILP